jgi:AcrR family transcriptional regulator
VSPARASRREPVAPPAGRRESKKLRHRQQILEAARVAFFRDGFMATNLDEVAEAAGLAKGTLYRYFDNKAELYVAVLSANADVFEERLLGAASLAGASPAEQVRAVSRFYLSHWMRNRDYFQIFWALDNESVIGELPPVVVTQITRLWEKCLRVLADVIRSGVDEGCFAPCDPWEVANILWTLANGLIQSERAAARRRLRRRRLERVFDDAIELVLRGLAASPSAEPARRA